MRKNLLSCPRRYRLLAPGTSVHRLLSVYIQGIDGHVAMHHQATLKLTREQERAILMARDAFKKGLINTAERRRSCLGVLAASPSDCILSEGRLAQLFVQEAQAADLVKATVMEEAALRNNLANAMRRVRLRLDIYTIIYNAIGITAILVSFCAP